MGGTDTLTIHASAVCVNGRGLLIRGASGRGKSALALRLMALGATLIADDRTIATRDGDAVALTAPEAIRGRIEARGIGILRAATVARARLWAVVDLDRDETDRLPPRRETTLLGVAVALVHNSAHASFPAALHLYLHGEREA